MERPSPTLVVSFSGTSFRLSILREKYAIGGGLAVHLIDDQDGMPFATVSINVEGLDLADNEFVFKTYSENEGLLEAMLAAGAVELTGRYCTVGPICRLNVTKLWPGPELPTVAHMPVADARNKASNSPDWLINGDFMFPGKWN